MSEIFSSGTINFKQQKQLKLRYLDRSSNLIDINLVNILNVGFWNTNWLIKHILLFTYELNTNCQRNILTLQLNVQCEGSRSKDLKEGKKEIEIKKKIIDWPKYF